MKIIEAQPIRREFVDIRCFDQGAKAAHLGEADIVEQKDDDVGRILFRSLVVRPPLFRVLIALCNDAAEAFDVLRFDAVHDREFRYGISVSRFRDCGAGARGCVAGGEREADHE